MAHLSELSTVEHPIIQLMQSMGYKYVDGNTEDIHNSCFGRVSTKDVLLMKHLKEAFVKINSDLPSSAIDQAILQLQEEGFNKNTLNANRDSYHLLRE